MDKNTFTDLLDRYISGNASAAETRLLEEYYEQLLKHESVDGQDADDESLRRQMLDTILSTVHQAPVRSVAPTGTRRLWLRVTAAAAIIVVVAGASLFFFKKEKPASFSAVPKKAFKASLLPGSTKAVLTLGNGTTVVLDSQGNGTLAKQGNSIITKSGGHLLYGAEKTGVGETTYNILVTPKGGQYHLTLADGTVVWLNALSSIRFPVSFNGAVREVQIAGEVYFEVAKNASKPFHVKVNDMTLEVLGTHFNVMAYGDEATINTTLLEGSVKVSRGKDTELLKPGQQSVYHKTAGSISVKKADTEKALAWKNGKFMFKGDDIRTIMRQISRWYDVKVSYPGQLPSRSYSGTISKYVDASEVLKILELVGIKFKIEGANIIVFNEPTVETK